MGNMLQLFLPLASNFLQTTNWLEYHHTSCIGSFTSGCYGET